jgi:hypothetical protein
MSWRIRYGALPASNSLSSAWMSARPPWRSPRNDDGRRRRAGGPLFTITPTPSRRSTVRGADDLVWASVWTSHPAAVTPRAFVAGCDSPSQCGMACPSADRGLRLGRASTLLDPDRDGAHGAAFIRRIRAMGVRDRPVSARSPWQNGYAGRLIGSIRGECLDHAVVVGERHLRHVLASYQKYYNEVRTHLSLQKDAPVRRGVCRTGRVRRGSCQNRGSTPCSAKLPMQLSRRCGAVPTAGRPGGANRQQCRTVDAGCTADDRPGRRRVTGTTSGNGRYSAEPVAGRRKIRELVRAMRALARQEQA